MIGPAQKSFIAKVGEGRILAAMNNDYAIEMR